MNRGSDVVWAIVGVLAIIALLIYVLPHLR
jgi:hypothetical protein